MIRTYEAWQDPRDGSITFALIDEIADNRAKGLIAPDARLLHRVEAQTHEEAMAIHHLRMGWEPYRPLGPPAPCPTCGAQLYPKGSGQCWQCGGTV